MSNFNKPLAKKIISELSQSTLSTLTNLQKFNIPQFMDLDIEVVDTGVYKYNDIHYTTKNLLLRINNPYNIKRVLKNPYKGPISVLINQNLINPFILFIDDEAIDFNGINIIVDDRLVYLELTDYFSYNFKLGSEDKITNFNGSETFKLPKISEDFNQGLMGTIVTEHTESIVNITFNGSTVQKAIVGNDISFVVPYSYNENDPDSIANNLTIFFNNSNVRTILIEDVMDNRRVVRGNISTLVFNSQISIENELPENTSIDDIMFILMGGMVLTYSEYIMYPLKPKTSFVIKRDKDLLFKEGKAYDLEEPFPAHTDKRFFKENFVVFKGNYLLKNNDLEDLYRELGDLTKLDSDLYKFKLFFNPNVKKSLDNMYLIDEDRLDDNIISRYFFSKIYELFDFKKDPEVLNEDANNINILNTISGYNTSMLDNYFEMYTKSFTRSYNGSDLIAISRTVGSDYMVTISKLHNGSMNTQMIVYYNGLLYPFDNIIENSNSFSILFDRNTFSVNDTIDILTIPNVYNTTIYTSLASIQDKRSLSGFAADIDDLEVYSDEPIYQSYELPINPKRLYKVDCEVIKNSDRSIGYKMDSFYYGKNVSICNKRQFRHFVYTAVLDLTPHRIILPLDFVRCQKQEHYMIFINGRRLETSHFIYVPHGEDLPLEEAYLLLTYRVTIGDRVTVIYLPDPILETNIAGLTNIPSNGIITLPSRDILGFPITKNSVSIYINGKKIPYKSYKRISTEAIAILTDIKTVNNLSIVRHIDQTDDVFAVYKSTIDIWSEYALSLPYESMKLLHNLPHVTISSIEPDITYNMYSKEMLFMEVLRHHWLSPVEYIDCGKLVNYSMNHPISMFKTIQPQCVEYIEGVNNGAAVSNVLFNRVPFDLVPSEKVISLIKLNDPNSTMFLYRKMNTSINKIISASIYILIEADMDVMDHVAVRIVGKDPILNAFNRYIVTLFDIDGNDSVREIQKRRWTRLSTSNVNIPNDINEIAFAITVYNKSTKIHVAYGRFDKRPYTDSGVQVITIDASKPQINELG